MPLALLDVVVLLAPLPDAQLATGQIGTVVDLLDGAATTVLVDFADDQGRALAIEPVPVAQLGAVEQPRP